jgi:2-keto-4-pentenoate hydratase
MKGEDAVGASWTSVAERLIEARRTGVACSAAPLADAVTNEAQAYAVQDAVAQALGDATRDRARHWKGGAPDIHSSPGFAALAERGVKASGHAFDAREFHWIGLEAELAFRVGRDVSAGEAMRLEPDTLGEVFDAMCVSVELCDSRWSEGLRAPPLLRMADAQSHAALVLGPWQPLAAHDWANQPCRVTIDRGPVSATKQFVGTHPCCDPRWVLPHWLRHVSAVAGAVSAGSVVTTGSWCGLLMLQAGDAVEAEFVGIGSALLSITR